MSTKNPRINITLEKSTAIFLTALAEHENIFVSSLAEELVLEALERREDVALSAVAEIRDKANVKRVKHGNGWK